MKMVLPRPEQGGASVVASLAWVSHPRPLFFPVVWMVRGTAGQLERKRERPCGYYNTVIYSSRCGLDGAKNHFRLLPHLYSMRISFPFSSLSVRAITEKRNK